jgi:hypothetical protein
MTPEEMEAEFGSGGGAASNTCSLNDRPISEASEENKKKEEKKKTAVEEDNNKQPAENITTTAKTSGNTACPLPRDASPPPPPPDVDYIYHLCQTSKWDDAKSQKQPYFPPTFMADGKFTRASVHRDDMVDVANEYYRSSVGDWILLELDCKVLYGLGIPMLAQLAPESTQSQPVKCLQILGGISTINPDLVSKIYPMKRSSDGTFIKVLDPIQIKITGDTSAAVVTPNRTGMACEKTHPEQPLEANKQDHPKRKSLFRRLRGTKNQ